MVVSVQHDVKIVVAFSRGASPVQENAQSLAGGRPVGLSRMNGLPCDFLVRSLFGRVGEKVIPPEDRVFFS